MMDSQADLPFIDAELGFHDGINPQGYYRLNLGLERQIVEYFSMKKVQREYRESYYNITIMIRDGLLVSKFDFIKKDHLINCQQQNCGCVCIKEGRVRILQIDSENINTLNKIRGSDIKIEEDAYDDKLGTVTIGCLSEKLIFNSRLIFVWCMRRLKLGEFGGGPRTQYISSQLEVRIDESIDKIMKGIMSCKKN
jgi:hypothetical protein